MLLSLPARGPSAGGLYDFFKKKEKPAQKSGKEEHEKAQKSGEGRSLFDFFKREEKEGGEGGGGEHYVIVHEYPSYYWPYPYDLYFYRYEPRRTNVIVVPSAPEEIGLATPFYPTEASPGTKMAVLRDIVLAWRDKNINLIKAHLDPKTPIACYFKRRFSHVLSPEEFLKHTERAFKLLDTRGFRLEKIYRSHNDKFYVKGVHVFLDPEGVLRKVPIDYCFVKRGGRWVIRKVSYYGSAKGLKCVIASAVFGPYSSEVEALEALRDDALWPSKAGRAFIGLYYRFSPGLAGLASRSKLLAFLLRLALRPLVEVAEEVGRGAAEPCEGPSLPSL